MGSQENYMQRTTLELNGLYKEVTTHTKTLKIIANKHRLLILCTLAHGEMSVGQINDVVPLGQSSLSQHLGRLREGNLVSTRRDKQTIYYRLTGNQAALVIEALQ